MQTLAVQVSKLGDIYIESSGDYSQLQKDLRGAVAMGKAMGKEISEVLFGVLTPKSAGICLWEFNKESRHTQRAAKGTTADLSSMDKQFRKISRDISVAEKS